MAETLPAVYNKKTRLPEQKPAESFRELRSRGPNVRTETGSMVYSAGCGQGRGTDHRWCELEDRSNPDRIGPMFSSGHDEKMSAVCAV